MSLAVRMGYMLGMMVLVLGSSHYYLWTHLVRDVALPQPWHGLATAGLISLGLLIPISLLLLRLVPLRPARLLSWTAYCWMGLFFIVFMLFLASDLVRGAIDVAAYIMGAEPDTPLQRLTSQRQWSAGVSILALLLAGAGLRFALGGPIIKRVSVPLARLPAALHGFTIAQVSDLHVGPLLGRAYVERVVAKVNALSPSLIAITGDLVDGSVAALGPAVAPLGDLRAPSGVFFVTGNHEYYSGVDAWLAHISGLGIGVLRNERVSIGTTAASFDLAGIDDWTAHHFGLDHGANLQRALAGRDPSRELVLLAHQPKAIVEAAALHVGLLLSGHTHGGQIWPFKYLVRLVQPYVAGLAWHGPTQIYVNSGTGYWGPPMRLGAPPEITLLELRAPQGPS